MIKTTPVVHFILESMRNLCSQTNTREYKIEPTQFGLHIIIDVLFQIWLIKVTLVFLVHKQYFLMLLQHSKMATGVVNCFKCKERSPCLIKQGQITLHAKLGAFLVCEGQSGQAFSPTFSATTFECCILGW